MFVSKDGTVTGSIDVNQLGQVEPKTDEAKAQLEALKAEVKAGQEQASKDADRLAELHEAQSAQYAEKDAVTTQGDQPGDPSAPAKAADQSGSKAADQKAAASKPASPSGKG